MDTQQTGAVEFESFKEILNLHKIKTDEKTWKLLQHKSEIETGIKQLSKVDYKKALKLLTINLNIADPLLKDWII
jgi:hypothetical protein